jgi:hypothetical protein
MGSINSGGTMNDKIKIAMIANEISEKMVFFETIIQTPPGVTVSEPTKSFG